MNNDVGVEHKPNMKRWDDLKNLKSIPKLVGLPSDLKRENLGARNCGNTWTKEPKKHASITGMTFQKPLEKTWKNLEDEKHFFPSQTYREV